MAKRRVGKLIHFHQDFELKDVCNYTLQEIETRAAGQMMNYWPDVRGPRQLSGKRVGLPFGHPDGLKLYPVERSIRVLVTPDPHVCDWRCMGAKPMGDCECECKGRNHGRNFKCD
jgi:hypothetical protein